MGVHGLCGRVANSAGSVCPQDCIAVICRKAMFTHPGANPRLPEHKNADFVLEKPENGGSGGQKRTKTSILCSKSPKTRVPDPNKAQKTRFCAREERKLASGSITSEKLIVNVAFLQIIAHTNVPWSCLEEGFVCAMNCRNGTPSQVAVVSGTQHLHTGQTAASFGGDT